MPIWLGHFESSQFGMTLKRTIYYFCTLSALPGLFLIAAGGHSADSDILLKPPGLRLINDPETIIPPTYHYQNRQLQLPQYRSVTGVPLDGWSRENL